MTSAFRPQRRSGLTLVEILIALTMTLIVLGTMMAAFRLASNKMKNGRALIELANRARIVEDYLRADLGRLTVETRVYDGTDEPNGYFEYLEGPVRDKDFGTGTGSFQGDCDDVLCFTARSSDGVLFRGRDNYSGATTAVIESSLAEIVWFTTVNGNDAGDTNLDRQLITGNVDFDDSIQLRRRALVIRPDLGTLASGVTLPAVNNFIRRNDISVRVVSNSGSGFDIIANGLDDLALRANRFAHDNSLFPNNFNFALLQNRVASDVNSQTAWQPLPPILSDVGAFDLRAYSPNASVGVGAANTVIVEPSDVGYGTTGALLQLGAYVDLGYNNSSTNTEEWFIANSAAPTSSGSAAWVYYNVWDTWTPFYERDGIDQDGDSVDDQGTNGVNDGGSNVIDDPAERETSPPYTKPIRGMKITLRLVERGTKQVHQVSVIQSFVPE